MFKNGTDEPLPAPRHSLFAQRCSTCLQAHVAATLETGGRRISIRHVKRLRPGDGETGGGLCPHCLRAFPGTEAPFFSSVLGDLRAPRCADTCPCRSRGPLPEACRGHSASRPRLPRVCPSQCPQRHR